MLTAFTAGLLLITVSELGDKTFFIAALLAMRHSRRLTFVGVLAALAAMTVISVLFGQVASLLPRIYVVYAEIALFTLFGLKLLYDASRMSAAPRPEEMEEAAETVKANEAKYGVAINPLAVCLEAFSLTFVAEWGDRTQFATIALAASNNPVGVTLGAVLGHGICAAIAVVCGRAIAGRISERLLTFIGGGLFLLFGAIATTKLL